MDCWLCDLSGFGAEWFYLPRRHRTVLYFGYGRRYGRSPMRAAAATQRPVASSTTSAARTSTSTAKVSSAA